MAAVAGTVTSHAATMVEKWARRTSLRRVTSSREITGSPAVSSSSSLNASVSDVSPAIRFAARSARNRLTFRSRYARRRGEFAVYHSRKKPTPNTAPTAMCVELTGSPNQEAMMTVSAADSATQKARIGLSLVICSPTILTSLGP